MKLINPIDVNDTVLTSSTIPEPDASQGEVLWSPGAYVVGDEVIKTETHRRYRCAVATSDDPESGVGATPPTWVDIGATNRYAMFDDKNGSKSIDTNTLEVELTPNQVYTALAMFYVNGAESIQVVMTAPVDGIVYDETISMLDNQDIIDYYEWFFYPIINITEFLLTDLPTYINATLKITITGGGSVEVGSAPFGAQSTLGVANYGTSFDLIDLSKKEQDEFGNYTIRTRPASDVVDFDVSVPRARTRYVRNLVATYRNKPVVWIGGGESDSQDSSSIFTFGYYKSFRVNIDSPSICSATLQVEELV